MATQICKNRSEDVGIGGGDVVEVGFADFISDIDGYQKGIPEINKETTPFRGNPKIQRSAIAADQFRWNGYVPYVLNGTLSLNDKGAILRAFEQLRLKACIDFKPRTTETDYIFVDSLGGCWSYIGKTGGRQLLSIGGGCAHLSIVEHEFLHALGFYHEQSRMDRDDYVTIVYENIIPGFGSNFDKALGSITQGTPYDYTSVMHYANYAFSNGSGFTIVTKVPQYQDVLGQPYDMSPTDALELNMLYNCSSSISFLDHCSFDDYSKCQMVTCSSFVHGWVFASTMYGGPFSDHSNLPALGFAVSMTNISSGPSFFMHFSTTMLLEGDSARLESRKMTPRRDCHVQCLQFFYYHNGNETDQLNIWIREYQSDWDTIGTLRLMDQIRGPPTDHWLLHHVPLNANKPFLVEFEGRKGAGYSRGGFSVDDINLSESECPQIWQIQNFMELWNKVEPGTDIFGPVYYSPDGYRYQVFMRLYPTYASVYIRLVSGIYDDQLQWPCPWRHVTFVLLDQTPNMQQRMSLERSFTTDPSEMLDGTLVWGKPSEVGTPAIINGTEKVNATVGGGHGYFMAIGNLDDREFVKDGDMILLISMKDISSLQQNDALPCASVPVKNLSVSPYQGAQEGSCTSRPSPTSHANTTTSTTTGTGTQGSRSTTPKDRCWSYIGKMGGPQLLSIGNGCEYISTVEHEFLHALGFYHEQSRMDRDDYVTIVYESILTGYASNFNKAPESTTQGTPYDYTSVMHYGQDAFSNGSGHTILTKVPQYQDVIGQRFDLSPTDALELSKLYNCSVPVVSMTNISSGPSFFMHFSTMTGLVGDSARLESRKMTPRRDCHVQCLQFFYYHSGNETDQLNIWIREYQSDLDTIGTLRLMDQITGPPTDHWKLHFVPLNANKPFLVEFEGRKGAGYSRGGFSVDDINLSESECPQVWQIQNFMTLWNMSASTTDIFSPAYYSPDGYRYQVSLKLSQTSISIYIRLVSGIYDDQLQWPCPWRQVTFVLLDQTPNMQQRMSLESSFTTDPSEMSGGKYVWGKPSEVGTPAIINGTEKVNATVGVGYNYFLMKTHLNDREFVKGDDLIFLISMKDISSLQQANSLPCASVPVKNLNVSPYQGAQEGSCATRPSPPPPANTTTTTTTGTDTQGSRSTTPKDEDRECRDFFCSGANIIHPSLALLLALVLLAVN
ncbi:hypothetical protein NFI96_010347 [Prochilodus magdalenae]|nr:hypothetical protein NFI96_010347 [Prochilodus magdalenae]